MISLYFIKYISIDRKLAKEMNPEVIKEIEIKTRELIEAPTCSQETKESATRWLKALGTDALESETKVYFEALAEDIMPIEQLIDFASSEQGVAYFGADVAARIAEHAVNIKATGAQYCDCPACAIVEEILAQKEEMLK